MGASTGVTAPARCGKLPAPSRHRSPTLSQSVRGSREPPASVARGSKIWPVRRPRQHGCKHRCDRTRQVRQAARDVAPSLAESLPRLLGVGHGGMRAGAGPLPTDPLARRCLACSAGTLPVPAAPAVAARSVGEADPPGTRLGLRVSAASASTDSSSYTQRVSLFEAPPSVASEVGR